MQLSYSSLSIFKNCPRCFYLDRKLKIPRPQGIKSGVPAAVDKILKESAVSILGLPEGFKFYSGPDLKKMQHWKSNPYKMEDSKGNVIVGAFDDLLVNPETGELAYIDYKTTGKEPDQEFGEKYYQSQCDIYTAFLLRGGKKVASFGVLLFYWPMPGEGGTVLFKSKPILLKPNPEVAETLFKEAVALLESPKIPKPGPECEYCNYVKNYMSVQA